MFPCTSCGSCCKRINRLVENLKGSELSFPFSYDETGKCEKLTDDNKCSVYKNRPLVCDIEKMAERISMPKTMFINLNIAYCNQMMDEDGVDESYRIK